MRMQEAVGPSFLILPGVTLSLQAKHQRLTSPVTTSQLPLRACCVRITCHFLLSPFSHSPFSYCVSSLPLGGLPVHSLESNGWIWLSLGTHMWLTHSSSPSPSWDPIFYIHGVPTREQLRSCLLQRWLHDVAQAMPTFPLPQFLMVSYWFWLPGLQISLLAVL